MQCPSCGAEQPEGAHNFCAQCGATLSALRAATSAPRSGPSATQPALAWLAGLEQGQRFALAGALAGVLGSFLPWAKLTAPLVGTLTVSGIDGGDGWLTLVLATAGGVLAWMWGTPRRLPAEWVIGAGAVLTLFALYEWVDIGSKLDDVEFVRATRGSGLFLTLAGGVLITVGGTFLRRSRST